MAREDSRYYAAVITHQTYDESEWQEVITRVNLKKLEALCAVMLTQDDGMDAVIRVEIHDRTYSKAEAKQLQLKYLR